MQKRKQSASNLKHNDSALSDFRITTRNSFATSLMQPILEANSQDQQGNYSGMRDTPINTSQNEPVTEWPSPMKNMPVKKPIGNYNGKKAKKGKTSGTTIYKRPQQSRSAIQSPSKSSCQVRTDYLGQMSDSLVK